MKKLIQKILLTVSIILISGCTVNNPIAPTSKPKIDENLPTIDPSSIRMIPDMKSIAIEWKGTVDPSTHGYNLYRSNVQIDGSKLKRIEQITNKYTSHFLDEDLEPSTQYVYSISTIGKNGTESRASQSSVITTKPRFESVSFLTAVNELPRQIKILWRPHTNQRVNQYIIQKRSEDGSKWSRIARVKPRLQVEYIDKNLKDNTKYTYRIVSETFDRIKSKPSKIVTAMTKALPHPVQNIKATYDLARKIKLTWEALEDISDIAYYQVYSSDNKDGTFETLAQVAPSDNTFIDMVNKDGIIKYYKVITVDKDELESSKKVNSTMGKTLDIPSQPIITLAQIQGDSVILNWISNDNRTVGYNIYKTIQKNYFDSKSTVISNISDLRFEDKDIVRGVTYKYSIQSIDENGLLSSKTPPATLIIPKLVK